ncbi:MAG TPA: glycosyltransferase family 2 protein [Geobacterales bacterium]|nr:glycosyltransferase family 2 protein [Geobacterales bacterium]
MNVNEIRVLEKFTIDNYNYVIDKISERKKSYFSNLIISSGLAALAFSKMQSITNSADLIIYSLKFCWILPLPIFVLSNVGKYNLISKEDLFLEPEKIITEARSKQYMIIFQIVTKGTNIKALERSILSVKYWISKIKEKYHYDINSEIWLVVDEEYKDNVEHLIDGNVRLIEIPRDFTTKKDTKYKARALEYANLIRRKLGLNKANVWVYHQDEETCVGEDTIMGILEFANKGNKHIGCGMIIYPLDWKNEVTYAEEMLRSADDLRLLSLIKQGKLPFGYHGSHFLTRADIEDEIGWDFGENRAEDMLFYLNAQKKSKELGLLKGFAYEKAPQNVIDFLKQRSRWIKGAFDTLKSRELNIREKPIIIYSILLWYLAIPSIAVSILSIFFPGGISPYLGFISGFVWYSLIDNYRIGYEMNANYIEGEIDIRKLIFNMVKGAILEAIAPWYSLFKKTKEFEIIKKD